MEWFNDLTPSDYIELFAALSAVFIGIVSIIISLLTLRQNSKMIEEESRPYITVYGASTNLSSPKYYVVVKNFGKSGAIIDQFSYTPELHQFRDSKIPFQHMVGTFIAPGHSFYVPVDLRDKEYVSKIKFFIRYHCGKKHYSEDALLNIDAYAEHPKIRSGPDGHELRVIAYTLQEFVERNL